MKNTIAIVDTSGQLGIELIKQLLPDNYKLKVMLSTDNITIYNELENIDKQAIDLNDNNAVSAFFKGCEKLVLVTPQVKDIAETTIKLAKAAVDSDVKQIIKISPLGTSPFSKVRILQQHAEAEDAIKLIPVAYTFIHTSYYLENLLNDIHSIKKIKAIYSPLGDYSIVPVSVEDVAACIATILKTDSFDKKTLQLTGPKAFTYRDYAGELSQQLQIIISAYTVPFDVVSSNLIKKGIPEWFVSDLIELMQSWTQTRARTITKDVEEIIKRPAMELSEFISKHIDKYKPDNQTYNDY